MLALGAPSRVADRVLGGCRAMDRAEAGCGEGDEQPGVLPDTGRDVLAAHEAGAHQVVGIPGMESGAGCADGGAAVAAAHGEAFVRLHGGVVVMEHLSGAGVPGGGGAGQVDGVGAVAGGGDLL